jgi:hypothetical protein
MNYNIEVEGGTSILLPTAGKYCDRDIVITIKSNDVDKFATISGVNLHDTATDTPNTYLQGASIKAYNNWSTTDFIPVEDGKFYVACSASSIDSKYCSKFDANKSGASVLSGVINCTDLSSPLFITGHDGYFRFSGTMAQINTLEFYEVINFNWKVEE